MINKECKECPWKIRNNNNDNIINHSKKWNKKHNCHILIKDTNINLWDNFPKFQCVGNKKELTKLISTTNVNK